MKKKGKFQFLKCIKVKKKKQISFDICHYLYKKNLLAVWTY